MIIFRSLVTILLIFVNKNLAQSPCPSIFDYQNDGGTTYGLIRLEPIVPVNNLLVQAHFSISGRLPTEYVGHIEPLGDQDLNRTILPGEVISLRVHFPVQNSLPKLVLLLVQNKGLCYGCDEKPAPGEIITAINLEYNPALPPKPKAALRNISTEKSLLSCLESADANIQENSESLDEVCGTVPLKTSGPLIFEDEFYPRGDWPWVVAIFKTTRFQLHFRCAGTLISIRHVLSTAICTKDLSSDRTLEPEEMLVKAGAYDLNDWFEDNTVNVAVKTITVHNNYDPKAHANNIAVLTLLSDLQFNDYIRPACLWRIKTKAQRHVIGHVGVVAGWSREVSTGIGPQLPEEGKFMIVNMNNCTKLSNNIFDRYSSETILCAGNQNGTGVSDSDLGAGMYLREKGDPKWRVRGIVSIAAPSDNDYFSNVKHFAIFTDVAQYLPWINNIIAT